MGLLSVHTGEFRRWRASCWGGKELDTWLRFATGTKDVRSSMASDRLYPDRSSFMPPESLGAQASRWRLNFDSAVSTILAADTDNSIWGRRVSMVSLSELFLHFQDRHTAATLYEQWLEAPIIIQRHVRGGPGPHARAAAAQSKRPANKRPWDHQEWESPAQPKKRPRRTRSTAQPMASGIASEAWLPPPPPPRSAWTPAPPRSPRAQPMTRRVAPGRHRRRRG